MDKYSVLIVDDDPNLRAGITVLLHQEERISEIFEASDGLEAITAAFQHMPSLILMDVGMPYMNGIEACKEIKKRNSEAKIIMLTSHDDERDIFAALGAGANGYCLKEADFKRIQRAVIAVANGDLWIDSSIAGKVLNALPSGSPTIKPKKLMYGQLSERETQVLQLIVEGLSNQDIADNLSIRKETVKTHIRHLMDKLAVTDRTQAAVKAIRYGLIKEDQGFTEPS